MLVVVEIRDVDLADFVLLVVAVHFGKHPHFETPVGGNADVCNDIAVKSKFSGERVFEAVHVFEVIILATDFLKGAEQRGNEQAADPAVHTVFGNAGIVALAVAEIETGVENGVNQTRQHLAVIRKDVAIVDRNDLRPLARQKIAEEVPDIATLALVERGEVKRLKGSVDCTQAGSAIPKHLVPLRQAVEKFQGVAVLVFVGLIEANHNFLQIINLAEDIDDFWQGNPLELRIQRGQDQSNRILA